MRGRARRGSPAGAPRARPMIECLRVDTLRRGVVWVYSSPKRCLWFVRMRLWDSFAAAAVFTWFCSLGIAEAIALPQPSFVPMFLNWLAFGFSSVRLFYVCMMVQAGTKAKVRFEQGETAAAIEVSNITRQAVRDMLAAGMALILLFTVVASHSMAQCAGVWSDPHFKWYAFVCKMQLVTSYVFVVWNWCNILIAVIFLIFEPREVHIRRNSSSKDGLQPELINSLQAHDFGDPAAPPTQPQCSICLEDYCAREKVRYLPCGHHFHAGCVDVWLSNRAACPLRCHNNLEAEAFRRAGADALARMLEMPSVSAV